MNETRKSILKRQRSLPYPLTDQDKGFMEYLLAGVRAKREQATAGKPTPSWEDRK
jgi:hypothetical protein